MVTMIFTTIVLLIAFAFLFSLYNNLVRLDFETQRSWSNIEVILKQRFDEVPMLVEITEQFCEHEKSIISDLVEARKEYLSAESNKSKVQASKELGKVMGNFFALSENYPELKSNNNFMNLMERISSLEETLADRRESFNESITNYNVRIHQVPEVIIAKICSYEKKDLLEIDKIVYEKPSVRLKLKSS